MTDSQSVWIFKHAPTYEKDTVLGRYTNASAAVAHMQQYIEEDWQDWSVVDQPDRAFAIAECDSSDELRICEVDVFSDFESCNAGDEL